MEQADEMRLVTKVARLYHTRGLRQIEIAERLHLSQPRVSRLLSQAVDLGVVRSIVAAPGELNRHLEDGLCRTYGLAGAQVVDSVAGDDGELATDLGQAAAPLLTAALSAPGVHTVGFTSWSRTLRQAVEAMRPLRGVSGHIVEMLGDLGAPSLQQEVAHVTQRLATLTGAEPVFLRVPGVMTSPVREALLRQDPHAREALRLLDSLDLALLSVGPCEVVGPLRPGDNYFCECRCGAPGWRTTRLGAGDPM